MVILRCIFVTVLLTAFAASPTVAGATQAGITVESCRWLTSHVPDADVAYRPGGNVRGRPIAPADLPSDRQVLGNPAPFANLEDGISFHLILDVAKEENLPPQARDVFQVHPGLKGEIPLGRIVIRDGAVTLDGKPLTAASRDRLYIFCRENKPLP